MEVLEFSPGDRERLLSSFVAGLQRLRGQVLPEATAEGLRLTGAALGAEVKLPDPVAVGL